MLVHPNFATIIVELGYGGTKWQRMNGLIQYMSAVVSWLASSVGINKVTF